MRLYFHDLFTEAHRTPERGQALADALAEEGVFCTPYPEVGCDLAFCGSVWKFQEVVENARRFDLPVVHFNWDIYKWQVDGKSPDCWKPELWGPYLEELKTCRAVFVPSQAQVLRTKEFTGRDAVVVLSSCDPWWKDAEPFDGGWVLDVMRKYPDPNRHAVREACDALGLPCVETGANLPWEEFRRAVCGARLLVSAYYEASTGGLTLLEGYGLGKRVLVSDSPYHGGADYFRDRTSAFRWNDPAELRAVIRHLWDLPPLPAAVVSGQRTWVDANYSDAAFARRLAAELRRVK